MENLKYWDKVSTPPPDALKTIKAGRLKGFTDVSPMWRYKIMTEVYGMCGFGWKFNIIKKWFEPGSDNQIFAFVDVELFIKQGDKWSDPIPGTGGSMLVAKEKAGLHSSDEAYKMATTDALSTALKVIGVAADIYMGKWDGSKYKQPPPKLKQITLNQNNINWLIGFCNKHKILEAKDKEDFQVHYKFDPYKTTNKEFELIKAAIELDYSEGA